MDFDMSTQQTHALVVSHQHGAAGGELAVSAQQAMARHEIEGAIVIARRFPRDEEAARARVMASCSRPTFAALATYAYPRGGKTVEGPSVRLAREIARSWGNLRYGCDMIHDDPETRTVRGWAWDVETNTRESQDATFAKLIFRKQGGWIVPDERELRELTGKHGSLCVRNCLLHVLPPDLIEDALATAARTLRDPTAARPPMADADALPPLVDHYTEAVSAAGDVPSLRSIYSAALNDKKSGALTPDEFHAIDRAAREKKAAMTTPAAASPPCVAPALASLPAAENQDAEPCGDPSPIRADAAGRDSTHPF
jgi:hypothetical protein